MEWRPRPIPGQPPEWVPQLLESIRQELVRDELAYEAHIRVAHQTGQYVPVEELVRCEAVLSRAVAHFFGAQ